MFVLMAALLAASPALLAADGGAKAQDGLLTFLANIMFWEILAFLLLLFVLGKFAFPMMFKSLSERQKRIEEAIAKADRVNTEATELLKKHEKMMAEAHAKAKGITEEANNAAEKMRQQIVDTAKKEAAEIVERAKNEIRMAQQRAVSELREQAVEMSIMASQNILKRALSGDDHRRLAEEAIATVSSSLSNDN